MANVATGLHYSDNKMKIEVNSVAIEFPVDTLNIGELLKHMDIPDAGIAVAVNNNIVKASERKTYNLKEGDKIIIIKAAYGG